MTSRTNEGGQGRSGVTGKRAARGAGAALAAALALGGAGCTLRDEPGLDAGRDGGPGGADAPFVPVDGPAPDFGPPRDTGGFCGGQTIPLTRLPARIVFVVDRSSSTLEPSDPSFMPTATDLGSCADTNASPASGITYRTLWDDLGGSVSEVAAAREELIEFGLTLFPGPGALSGTATLDAFCTARPPTTLVAPALRSATAIADTLAAPANAPLCAGGFTPTRRALEVAADALAGSTDGVLVLATDGAPNCATMLSGPCVCTAGSLFCGSRGGPGCLDDAATVSTIAALAARGIRTYVVGIPGTEAYADVLDAMAVAGGTARTGGAESYYRADDAPALLAALGTISDREVSCRFALDAPPPNFEDVNVLLDDVAIPRDVPDGWVLAPDGSAIELTGDSCARLRAGTIGSVQFLFGCPYLF
jgi:hypothetical protein